MEETGYSTSDDNGDGEPVRPQQLTRAQRKRLRKKKLKEDACRRGKIIGPLLPSTRNDVGDLGGGDGDVVEKEPPAVRRSATENKLDATTSKSGEEDPDTHAHTTHPHMGHQPERLARKRVVNRVPCWYYFLTTTVDSIPLSLH